MQERGLKYKLLTIRVLTGLVAPYAGAWIEIVSSAEPSPTAGVAPYAGAWIEILFNAFNSGDIKVAPYAGAWIEIPKKSTSCMHNRRRSLCRSVD